MIFFTKSLPLKKVFLEVQGVDFPAALFFPIYQNITKYA